MAKIDIEGLLGQIAKEGAQENAHSAIDSAIEENDNIQAIKPKQKTHPILTSKRMDITISQPISINTERSF